MNQQNDLRLPSFPSTFGYIYIMFALNFFFLRVHTSNLMLERTILHHITNTGHCFSWLFSSFFFLILCFSFSSVSFNLLSFHYPLLLLDVFTDPRVNVLCTCTKFAFAKCSIRITVILFYFLVFLMYLIDIRLTGLFSPFLI